MAGTEVVDTEEVWKLYPQGLPGYLSRTKPHGIDFESFEGKKALWAGLGARS